MNLDFHADDRDTTFSSLSRMNMDFHTDDTDTKFSSLSKMNLDFHTDDTDTKFSSLSKMNLDFHTDDTDTTFSSLSRMYLDFHTDDADTFSSLFRMNQDFHTDDADTKFPLCRKWTWISILMTQTQRFPLCPECTWISTLMTLDSVTRWCCRLITARTTGLARSGCFGSRPTLPSSGGLSMSWWQPSPSLLALPSTCRWSSERTNCRWAVFCWSRADSTGVWQRESAPADGTSSRCWSWKKTKFWWDVEGSTWIYLRNHKKQRPAAFGRRVRKKYFIWLYSFLLQHQPVWLSGKALVWPHEQMGSIPKRLASHQQSCDGSISVDSMSMDLYAVLVIHQWVCV